MTLPTFRVRRDSGCWALIPVMAVSHCKSRLALAARAVTPLFAKNSQSGSCRPIQLLAGATTRGRPDGAASNSRGPLAAAGNCSPHVFLNSRLDLVVEVFGGSGFYARLLYVASRVSTGPMGSSPWRETLLF